MQRLRVIAAGAIALLAGIVFFGLSHQRGVAAQAGSCGMGTFANNGVVYRVLFAKNGAVQQYLLSQSTGTTEKDHDALKAAEAQYGPEAVNAPPLQIISFKPGAGGMMVPDKAVDS